MYFRQKKKFFCVVIVCILISFFVSSCSLLEKEEVNFKVEEDTNDSTKKEEQTKTAETTKEKEISSTKSDILYVYLCGQVKNPGVYSLEAEKRVNDAINLAGGFTKDAAIESLNLARKLVDGEQIYVMSKEEAALSQTTASQMTNPGESQEGSSSSSAGETKVNINTASKEELMTLTGIGQAKADSIIAYRQENGPFQNVEEIKQIEGIKDGVFLKIKDQITV